MILATKFCLVLAAAASILSVLSIGTIEAFDRIFHPGTWGAEMGDWFVCLVWIGGGTGCLAFCKIWVNNPSFNTGRPAKNVATNTRT